MNPSIRSFFVAALLLFPVVGKAQTPVMVQDFEKTSTVPKVWVVDMPNENAAAKLVTNNAHDASHCLQLHYHFISQEKFQYLGIPIKTKIHAPIHQVHFWIRGDNSRCSFGVQILDSGNETHQFKHAQEGSLINFEGWKEFTFNLDGSHETWGGDKNGKLDYPLQQITLTLGQPKDGSTNLPVESDLYFDSVSVTSEKDTVETLGCKISVLSPAYCSDVQGNTRIEVSAPGLSFVTAKCWKQGEGVGENSLISTVSLDANGHGVFQFPADDYPHGPVTISISGSHGSIKDNCYLQLYNKGGKSWNSGLPAIPPAAAGMTLVFADDFDGALSISSKDSKATYYDHKPPNGSQDFSSLSFTSFDAPNNPFAQMDTFLRIRANEATHSAGLISSMKNDGTGVTAKIPCYFECRFLGPNAPGTWPAFWIMTDYMSDYVKGIKVPCDELDVIEAYGGEGRGSPNAFDSYMVTPHCWDQGETGKTMEKEAFEKLRNPIKMRSFGIPSTWYETFHTYGCKITEADTIYYCDNIEVGRHPTLPLSKRYPFFFMINLATGGGWPVDLSRYDGKADMYVDFVRVYQGK